MDKGYLLCTDVHDQPVTESGQLYYCQTTGGLTILNDKPYISHEASKHEKTNEIETNVILSVENEDKSGKNEDRFTHDMTIKLLEIIQSKFHLLNDKMHSKKKIWSDIALEMQKNGYLKTYGSKGGDKCHQRWRNLEKIYYGHCRYMKSTGRGKKKPPKYFDEMHELIGEKHSSQPVNLLDSLGNVSTAAASDISIETRNY